MKKVWGIIHYYDEDNRLIGIKNHHQILYFRLAKNQIKTFSRYLEKGIYIKFETNMLLKHNNFISYYEIINVLNIACATPRGLISFYDDKTLKDGFKEVINKPTYRMFLDLEFSMPPFNYKGKAFYSEIIEYGIILEDDKGNLISSKKGYIKPKCKLGISDRTLSFLHEDKANIENASNFTYFYNVLKDYLVMYQPVIYIWGRNDYLMLQKAYQRYNLKALTSRANFINLMQIMKTYYHIKDDIGLYSAFDLFLENPPMAIQDHDPLHDAAATSKIYHLFSSEINN